MVDPSRQLPAVLCATCCCDRISGSSLLNSFLALAWGLPMGVSSQCWNASGTSRRWLGALVLCWSVGLTPPTAVMARPAEVLLMRHGHKTDNRANTNLSLAGFQRALALATALPTCFGQIHHILTFVLNPSSAKTPGVTSRLCPWPSTPAPRSGFWSARKVSPNSSAGRSCVIPAMRMAASWCSGSIATFRNWPQAWAGPRCPRSTTTILIVSTS